MLKYLTINFVAIVVLLIPIRIIGMDSDIEKSTVSEAKSDSSIAIKSPRGAMIRSLVVPGWGQFYNGKWFKGIVVIGTEVGIVANAYYLDNKLDQSTTEYEQEFYRDNRNLSYWWLGAAILLSMLDAYVDAHLYDFDESENLTLNLHDTTVGNHTSFSGGRTISLTSRYRI